MRRLLSVGLAATLLASAPLWTQTNPSPTHPNPEVAALLNSLARSHGGWEKVRSIRAFRWRVAVQLPDKSFQQDALLMPDRLRLEDNSLGYPRTVIVTPQLGMAFAPGKTDEQMTPAQKESWTESLRGAMTFLLQQSSDLTNQLAALPGEKVGGVETKILERKSASVRQWLYVDPETGRILRDVRFNADGSRSTLEPSNWVTVEGVEWAVVDRYTGQDATGKTTSAEGRMTGIEFNPPVDFRLFERNGPSLASTPFHPAPMLPAPEPPRTASLNIRSLPGNAQVYLNDEFRGTSSDEGNLAVSNLKPGSYRLRVSLIGYKQWTQPITLAAGDNRLVEVRLEPAGPKPLELNEVEEALKNGISPKRLAEMVKQFGVDFVLTDELEQRLRSLGADSDLLLAITKTRK